VKPGDTKNAGGERWWEQFIKLYRVGIAYGKAHKFKKKNLGATSKSCGGTKKVPF